MLHFKLSCKYFHLLGKNLSREYFYQRAREVLEEGIEYLTAHGEKAENKQTKNKYICKLLEALAHLYCEPLYFEKADEVLKQAEQLYKKIEEEHQNNEPF